MANDEKDTFKGNAAAAGDRDRAPERVVRLDLDDPDFVRAVEDARDYMRRHADAMRALAE